MSLHRPVMQSRTELHRDRNHNPEIELPFVSRVKVSPDENQWVQGRHQSIFVKEKNSKVCFAVLQFFWLDGFTVRFKLTFFEAH
jgi:hypothetical protein